MRVLVDRPAADEPRRRIQAHRFGDDPRRVGESVDVGDRRQPSAEHAVDLVVQPRFDVGRLTEEIPRPRERVRRRLVPGEEDRHRLVADLPVGHPAAFVLVVLRQQQHRQQVAAIAAAGAALARSSRR